MVTGAALLSAAAAAFAVDSARSATTVGSAALGTRGGATAAKEGAFSQVTPYPAPPLEGHDILSGRPLSLADLGGRVVILEFWESWCEPCHAALINLQRAARADPAGAAFIGIDVADRTDAARAALRHAGVTLPNIADPSGATAARYRVLGTPTIVVIGPDRRVRAEATGPVSSDQILQMARIG